MRSFVRAIRRLIFRSRDRTAQKADARHPSHIKPCPFDDFGSKSGQRFPEKGWHLLARIGYTGPTAKVDQMHDIELDEDILERIDFLACLFAGRRINK